MKRISIITLFFLILFFFGAINVEAEKTDQSATIATLAQAPTTPQPTDEEQPLPSSSAISGNLAGINCGNADGTLRAQRCCPIRGELRIMDKFTSAQNHIPNIGCLFLDHFCVSTIFKTLFSFFGTHNFNVITIDYLAKMIDKPRKCAIGEVDESSGQCMCVNPSKPSVLCDYYLNKGIDTTEHEQCSKCYSEDPKGVWTAIGCVRSDFAGFITYNVLGWGVSIAGLIAFACIIYSAFIIQTSSGNPEKLKKAQETLTSCIVGLLIVIFSIFILKVIGVDILRIPGFMSK